MKKTAFMIMLQLLLISVFTFAVNIQPIKTETIRWARNYDTVADSHTHTELMNISQLLFSQIDNWNLNTMRVLGAKWEDIMSVNHDSGELIIGVDGISSDSYSELIELIRSSGGELVNRVSMRGRISAVVADIPQLEMSTFVMKAHAAGLSRYVEPNVRLKADFIPNDPGWQMQWGPPAIEADFAWNTTVGDSSIIVAVIDSGIDLNHEDLDANIVPLGFDWVNNDTNPWDDYGHGTHCAGIIAAMLNNSFGIAGLAQVRLMAEKVLNQRGEGSADDVANAIVHAVDQGADILSMSLGSLVESTIIHAAIKYADEQGVLIIGSAGNDASEWYHWPASYKEVIAVTATSESDDPAEFTNHGDWVEVAAPGVNIYSTWLGDEYKSLSGTSMSAPHVTGVVALIWSQFPNMTRDQVRAQLRYTADDLGDPTFDEYYGYGLINARRAVEQDPPVHDVVLLHWKAPYVLKPFDTAIFNSTLLNFGTANEDNLTVQLLVNGTVEASKLVNNLTGGASIMTSHLWSPIAEGTYNVTIQVIPVNGETATQNNVLSENLIVRISKTFEVPNDFPRIQNAINKVDNGSTIQVEPGTYYEHIIVPKSMTIHGENSNTTIIDGSGIKSVIKIFANNVSINGFTIQNSGSKPLHGDSGIVLYSLHNNISSNIIWDNYYGIRLLSKQNTIVGNIVANSARGISLEGSNENILRDNHMIGNTRNLDIDFHGGTLSDYMNDIDDSNTVDGKPVYYWVNQHNKSIPSDAGYVAILNSTQIIVKDLNLSNNGQGLLFVSTTNSTVANVQAFDNSIGIYMVKSDDNTIHNCMVTDNLVGIWLSYCSGNIVEANTASKGMLGIALYESSYNSILGNTLLNNTLLLGIGFSLESNSNCNSFFRNNLISNSIQVNIIYNSVNNTFDNGYEGNYWSNYVGLDSDGDGIGDSPYAIDENNTDNYPLMNLYWNPADINHNLKVDIYDVVLACNAYSSTPSDPHWNPHCDIAEPYGFIDIYDVVMICSSYGEEYLP
ncbi:S8 family serine peptidase [Candidatus Bathyarchaeota archaeon]|nr:S8 family serine peptidase [Candidatus Bathyarchaeota archaeon]